MKKIFSNIKYYIYLLTAISFFITACFFFAPLVSGRTQNIQVVDKTAHTVTLKWEKKSKALGYQIKVIKQKNHKLVKKVLTTKKTKKIKHLKPDTLYLIKVRAKYRDKYGKYLTKKVRTQKESEDVNTNINSNDNSNTNAPVDPEPVLNIPFGFWGLNGYDDVDGYAYVQSNFNADTYMVTSTGPNYNNNTLLPAVESAEMTVNLNITGNYTNFADAHGNFDITLWETALANYFSNPDTATTTQTYIDNGTLNSIMILDDIYNFTGTDPTAEELEQMACDIGTYINVTTWFREDINENLILENPSFQFFCLDAVGFQYSTRKGAVADYITGQQQAANNINLDVVAGLNIADGGNGSSGQQGWSGSGYFAMSADEITNYGEAMLGMDNIIMFLMWEYDGVEHWPDDTIGSDYFNQPELQQTLYDLGQLANNY